MVIQMLGRNEFGVRADTAMLDFEDSMKPDFQNVLNGYRNVIGAVNGSLTFKEESYQNNLSKTYCIDQNDKAYVMVRVRGLHLIESHVKIFGTPISAGLLDLIVCFFHTYRDYLNRGEFPKFYIPKCEHFLEARWWNEVLSTLEDEFDLKRGTIKVTFLIETLPATLQVEEILFEIKDHAVGLNVGRWDKIFSDIKTFQHHPDRILADRASIDMSKPWMENYAKRVIKICHSRGALAIGGMAAYTPGKTDQIRNEQKLKVQEDKIRESAWGHDGCWVSHPYFIGVALKAFSQKNQLHMKLDEFDKYADVLPQGGGPYTLNGLRKNIRVGIAYIYAWNKGKGCLSLDLCMEDLATLEISRSQVWQWLHHQVRLENGQIVSKDLVQDLFDEELKHLAIDPDFFIQEDHFKADLDDAKSMAENLYLRETLEPFFCLDYH
jgi:malate synthase